MAVHNFNKTYTYVSAKYVDKSESDNTQIISSVKIKIDAVDQADSSKTITLEEERALNYHYHMFEGCNKKYYMGHNVKQHSYSYKSSIYEVDTCDGKLLKPSTTQQNDYDYKNYPI